MCVQNAEVNTVIKDTMKKNMNMENNIKGTETIKDLE